MESFPVKSLKEAGKHWRKPLRTRAGSCGRRLLSPWQSEGDPALLDSVVPAMSDEKDTVRYAAAAAVLRLSEAAEKKRKEAKKE